MAVKEQNLRINITGDSKDIEQSFKEVISKAKETEVVIDKVTTSMDNFGKVTSLAINTSAKELEKLKASLKGVEGVKLTQTTNQAAVRKNAEAEAAIRRRVQEQTLAGKAARAKAADASRLATIARQVELEKSIIINGAKSVETFKVAQANRIKNLELRLQKDLSSLRNKVASGELKSTKQVKERNRLVKIYKRELLSLHKQTDSANRRESSQKSLLRKQNADIVAAKKKQLTLQRQNSAAVNRSVSGIKGAVRAQRNWTLQIAEGIGLYRAVSFAISNISRAILAVPKIGIERQTTEAVFEATLGGGIGSDAAFGAISKEAERTGIAVNVLRETFRNLNASMTLAGENSNTVFKVFSDLNTVSTALHLTADKTSSVFAAIAQIFNKNKVQSEELVKQLGNLLPGAFASFQKANEKAFASTEDLIKQMSLGTVVAHETVANFTDFLAKRFNAGFALATVGLQANLGRMQTGFIDLGEAIFAVSKGPMVSIIKSMTRFAEAATEVVTGTSALSNIFNGALLIGTSLIATKILKLVGGIAKLTVNVKAAKIGGLQLTRQVGIATWAGAGAVAVKALTAALRIMGGPLGLAVTGVTALTFAFSQIGKEARNAELDILAVAAAKAKLDLEVDKKPITLEFALENNQEVLDAITRVKTLKGELSRLQNKKTGRNSRTSAGDKAIQSKAAIVAQAEEQLFLKRQLLTDTFNKDQAEQAKRSADLGKQNIAKTIKSEKASQVEEIGIAKDTADARIKIIERLHKNGVIKEKNYLAEKRQLLLDDVTKRIAFAKKEKNGIDGSDLVGQLKADRKLKALNLEAAEIKDSIRQERIDFASSRARSVGSKSKANDNAKIREEKAYQAALLKTEQIIDRLQGQGKTNAETIVKKQLGKQRELIQARVAAGKAGAAADLKRIDRAETMIRQQAKLTELLDARSRAAEGFSFKQDLISAKAQTGLQGEITTMLRLDEIREDYIASETVRISKLEAELKNTSSSGLSDEITEARRELALLQEEGGNFENFIQTSLADSFASAFEGFILGSKTAKESMVDLANGILKQIARLAAQELASQLIGLAVDLVGSYASSGSSFGSGYNSTTGLGNTSVNYKLAKGGVTKGLSGASNSILSSATYFPDAKVTPLASGGVVAGEAGSEAVMPLKRLPSGNLGVEADLSSSGGSGIIIQQLIVNLEQSEDQTSQEQSEMLGKAIKAQLETLVDTKLQLSKRSGGIMNPTQLQAEF